ncbi:hypothetical protein VAA_02761 [Vibrio anguillarum 775]|nr:hypothetical protein VAA_02761 [Vibrio anguillarum 775]STY53597.1 Uncharacterised protein [Vibrio anguillarum]
MKTDVVIHIYNAIRFNVGQRADLLGALFFPSLDF